jgi:hypothetical protein
MADQKTYDEDGGQFQDIEIAQASPNLPYPFPLPLPRASGLYQWKQARIVYPRPGPQPVPVRPIQSTESIGQTEVPAEQTGEMEIESAAIYPWWFHREELRLDVDGRYPQKTASGSVTRFFKTRVEWIADLGSTGTNKWSGKIWYKDGDIASFPYTNIQIKVFRSWFASQRRAVVTFSGGGASARTMTFYYKSPYFRTIELEYDRVTDSDPETKINTCDHPNRPATLPCEDITIETVFRRAGFQVSKSGGDGTIPLAIAGPGGTWSDMEMHDAMQTYWSRFANRASWSLWTLFAGQHDRGHGLGGIMFDDIGPNHRQGTAIFTNSFISDPPAGETHAAAWIKRMKFWTAVHEMGHAFNLAHSWQKSLGTPWIPLSNEPEARSFMNYPYNVSGGQSAFFSDFEYRFSDGELLFMRHAPERFVQMGNADWFDHHGFQQANQSPEPSYQLELRVHRKTKSYFEFLEPVTIELKLTNVSNQAQLLPQNVIIAGDNLTIIIKKDGKAARQFIPFAQYCMKSTNMALNTGQSIYTSMMISAGRNGWDIAEPGYYTIQAALHADDYDIVSNPLRLRVAPPLNYDQEFIAQDFFSEDVGRVLTFHGSQYLDSANNTLQMVCDEHKESLAAIHAGVALGNAKAKDYKLLKMPEDVYEELNSAKDSKAKITKVKADVRHSSMLLAGALSKKPDEAADTLSHVQYKVQVDSMTDWLEANGKSKEAGTVQNRMYKTLANRGVLKTVLAEISKREKGYKKSKAA